jgi:hypothetical protein
MDYWGEAELWARLNFMNSFAKPRIELVDPLRGLVKVKADGPVAGFAFYAQRNGTWVKIGEVSTKVGSEYRSCVLVNASRLFPWDPILVLPLVEQELDARRRRAQLRYGAPRLRFCSRPGPTWWGTPRAPEASWSSCGDADL